MDVKSFWVCLDGVLMQVSSLPKLVLVHSAMAACHILQTAAKLTDLLPWL